MASWVPPAADREDIATVERQAPVNDRRLALEYVPVVGIERRLPANSIQEISGLIWL